LRHKFTSILIEALGGGWDTFQLLAQSQILQDRGSMAAPQQPNQPKQSEQERGHGVHCSRYVVEMSMSSPRSGFDERHA
jgi:hypothetical protein